MIARVWHGVTRAEHSAEYAHYLEESGIRQARANEGSRGTLVLRRTRGDYAEFETILLFDSLEDVKRFAGDDLEAAVFFPGGRSLPGRPRPRRPSLRGGRAHDGLTWRRSGTGPVAQPIFKIGEAA